MIKGKVDVKASFSDSEMLTLMIGHDFVPYPSETQYIAYMRANHLDLFPRLLDQSQYNRRARKLASPLEQLRRDMLQQLGIRQPEYGLLDSKPVPVLGQKRNKRHSDFLGSADYGFCSARQLHYFGYKLILLATLDGVPLIYDLVPASTDERRAADSILGELCGTTIIGDKGFIGDDWQAEVHQSTGNTIWTQKRSNQKQQNRPEFDRLIGAVRERIEGVFHSLQNTGRNLERLLAKRVQGLVSRIVAKVTALAFRHFFNLSLGWDILSFSISH
jgi:hypothetical protein